MKPSEVRNTIRREHEYILTMVRRARRVGLETLEAMAAQVRELVAFLDGHITREERELLPMLEGQPGWSEQKQDALYRHHEQQRRDFAVLIEWTSKGEDISPSLKDHYIAFLDDIELDVHSENSHLLTREMLTDTVDRIGSVTGEIPKVDG